MEGTNPNRATLPGLTLDGPEPGSSQIVPPKPQSQAQKRRAPKRDDEQDEDEDAPYDKSHLPEYVRVGGQIMHRNDIPDDMARLIDLLGEEAAAPRPSMNDMKASQNGKEWETDSSDDSSTSSDSSDSEDDSEDETMTHPRAKTVQDEGTKAVEDPSNVTNEEEQTLLAIQADEESSDSSDDGDTGLMDPYEQAKMLMAEDKDDADDKASSWAEKRPAVAKPDVEMKENEPIQKLGQVKSIVEQYVLVQATPTNNGKVLDSGSVLCDESRKVIGVIDDLVGRVEDPHYSIYFNSRSEISDEGLEVGKSIFYVERYARFALTKPLWQDKGVDVGGELEEDEDVEVYFSDDEKEAEYRRQRKGSHNQARDSRNGPPPRRGQSSRGNRRGRGRDSYGSRGAPSFTPRRQHHGQPQPSQPINYDDEPYVKLDRPGARNGPANSASPQSSRSAPGSQWQSTPTQQHSQSFGGQYQDSQAGAHSFTGQATPMVPPPMPNVNFPPGAFINPSIMPGQGQQSQSIPPPPPPQLFQFLAQNGQMPQFIPPPPPGYQFPQFHQQFPPGSQYPYNPNNPYNQNQQ